METLLIGLCVVMVVLTNAYVFTILDASQINKNKKNGINESNEDEFMQTEKQSRSKPYYENYFSMKKNDYIDFSGGMMGM